jgi:hypothetical protein
VDTVGWPGVFRPLRHHVSDGSTRLALDGGWVYFALCRSPCRPPAEFTVDLPWCTVCWAARRRTSG